MELVDRVDLVDGVTPSAPADSGPKYFVDLVHYVYCVHSVHFAVTHHSPSLLSN